MQDLSQKPRIGFVLGDQAGIGPEIVLKLLQRPFLYNKCTPIVIGNFELLSRMAKKINPDFLLVSYQPDEVDNIDFSGTGVPVVNIDGDVDHVVLGMVNTAAGLIACHSIVEGYRLLETGLIEGMILAPVTKEAISKSECGFHSEYEILASCAGVAEAQTIVKGGGILRASVVGHSPFRDIIKALTPQRIEDTGRNLAEMIQLVTGAKPHMLAAALNSCEDGIWGEEERDLIAPVLEKLRKSGIDISDPLPADTVLRRAIDENYNGILYMYHDQGNIAMKTQMFQTTACIYTHIPYPVLSTGHGSALDIADLGVANPTNISYVLTVLIDIIEEKRKMTRAKAIGE